MTPKKATRRPVKRGARQTKGAAGFTDEERAAMRERAHELKDEARKGRTDGEGAVLAKIAELPAADRAMATRIHELITANAPTITPRTWYGMPAYAREGKVVCFFQGAQKFKTRYATLGFSDQAHLDDGAMWPTAFALARLTPVEETRILELVRRAVG